MFYGESVQDTRPMFYLSWQKYRENKPLLPLEKQIAEVILTHPEYHALFERTMPDHHQAYFPELGETNPFLHLGFHLAIREQVATDRPTGIASIFQQLMNTHMDTSTVEHLLMDHLADCLLKAQREQTMPDEALYLNACRQLLFEN